MEEVKENIYSGKTTEVTEPQDVESGQDVPEETESEGAKPEEDEPDKTEPEEEEVHDSK